MTFDYFLSEQGLTLKNSYTQSEIARCAFAVARNTKGVTVRWKINDDRLIATKTEQAESSEVTYEHIIVDIYLEDGEPAEVLCAIIDDITEGLLSEENLEI